MRTGTTKKRTPARPSARAHVVAQDGLVLTLQARGTSLERGAGERDLRALHLEIGDCISVLMESQSTLAFVETIDGDRIVVRLPRAVWFPDELARGITIKRIPDLLGRRRSA